jgi:hypothetical protein
VPGVPQEIASNTRPSSANASACDARSHVNASRSSVTLRAALRPGAKPEDVSATIGYELIAAGMLILAGRRRGVPLDHTELEHWMRVGYERGTAMRGCGAPL